MGHALLAFRNRVNGAIISGGSYMSTLPRSNLLDRVIGNKARTSNTLPSSTQFTLDLGTERSIKVAALAGHNFSNAATHRLIGAFNSDFTSLGYDSGVQEVWPGVYDTMNLRFEDPNWFDGKWTEEEKENLTATLSMIFPEVQVLRYWKWQFWDTTNSAGYVEYGRPFFADGWQPAVNITYPESLQWEDTTEVDESWDGTEYFDVGTKRRVARITTDWMSEADAMRAFDIQRLVGVHDEMFYAYDVDDVEHSLRRQFLCRARQLPPVEHTQLLVRKTAWELKELT